MFALVTPIVIGISSSNPASAASPSWQSGVYRGACATSEASSFGSWRGASVERVLDFVPSTNWSAMSNPSWIINCHANSSVPLTLSVAMIPDSGATVEKGATGTYNTYWTTLAKNLVKSGLDDATLRIGWEMNGKWFPWTAVGRTTAWKNYWVNIVKSMRSVSGQHFTFDWSPNLGSGTSGFNVESAYPGDAYVDYIGASVYDALWGEANATMSEIWSHTKTQPYGLDWQASFANSHGKKLAYSEWALTAPANWGGGGGGDDTTFIQQFYNWVSSHNVAYEIYFDKNVGANIHQFVADSGSTNYPNAAKTYKSTFGAAAAVADPAPATSSDALVFSKSSSRTSTTALSGATVSGDIYALVKPSGSVEKVVYYIDDSDLSGSPYRGEYAAPYDLAGTGDSGAKAYNVNNLSAGKHTVTAVISYTSGSTKVVNATFTRS